MGRSLDGGRAQRSRFTWFVALGGLAITGMMGNASGCHASTDPHHDCLALVGSVMTAAPPGGAAADASPTSCGYISDGPNALLYLEAANATTASTTYFYFSGAAKSGTYTLTASSIAGTGVTSSDWSRKAALAQLSGAPAGTVMVALVQASTSNPAAATTVYESAPGDSGSVSLTNPGPWPDDIGASAATAITFEAVPLHVTERTGAPAKVTGTINLAVSVSNNLKECSPPAIQAEGASCVDFTAKCTMPFVKCGTCPGTECTAGGKCCVRNGQPCTGALDCCSEFCNSARQCDVPPAANNCAPSSSSSSGGTCDTTGASYGPCAHTSDCASQGQGYTCCSWNGADCSCAVCATGQFSVGGGSSPCDTGQIVCP